MDVLKKYKIEPDQKLEQCFLIDKNIAKELVKFAKTTNDDIILDLGAGTGAITEELAKKAKKVIAVEKDGRYYYLLLDRFKRYSNVDVLIDDVLTMEFPRFDKIVCNLPFNVYEPFFKILSNLKFKLMIIICSYGFAKIILAKPGDKGYSKFTELVQSNFDVKKLKDIPKESFFPQPRVTSSIIELTRK
jgi:16S rRNA (adenine1518-N6/adenine1519-N6)-dimethyltransferase